MAVKQRSKHQWPQMHFHNRPLSSTRKRTLKVSLLSMMVSFTFLSSVSRISASQHAFRYFSDGRKISVGPSSQSLSFGQHGAFVGVAAASSVMAHLLRGRITT